MAPNVAPYVRQKKSKSGKLLEFLGWFTVIIWPVFYYICKLFPWDEADPIDTKQNDIKSSLILMDDEYGEDTSSLPISAANTHHTSLEDYKNHFQQFGKDVHDKVIEGISQKLIQLLGKELEQIILKELRTSFCERHEFKKPATEEDFLDGDFKKEGKKYKKAVENCAEKDEFKHQDNKLKSEHNANQGPNLLQCSGGDGNDAPSMNQPTVNQCEQSRQTTANPSHGYGNNGGGFGGDGNDPPKRNPESLKGHYLESDVPLKKKDEMAEDSFKVQLETLVIQVPCPESSGSSNESTANENRLTVQDENESSEMQVDRPLSLENMSLSDDKNKNSQSSDNGIGVGLLGGNEVGLVHGNKVGLLDGNEVGLVDRHEVGSVGGNEVGLLAGNGVGLVGGNKVGLLCGNGVGLLDGNEIDLLVGNEVGLLCGNGVGLVGGNKVCLVHGNGVGLVHGNKVGLVDGFGQSAMDGNWSSAAPVNTVDMPSDSENEHSDDDVDNDGNLGQNDSETVVEQHYPDNIPIFHRNENNDTQTLKSPYKLLHKFQPGLNVGIHDGLCLPDRDFVILSKIGCGKFGVCYEILEIKSGKKFALKKILCEDFKQNEIKIWSVLSSNENVVTLLGAYDDGKHVNIFMELMEGTLKYIADNHEFLNIDERRAAALMKPILKFLAFMHDDGYIHADIKPDNILFGNNDVKVGDFGLAVDRRDTTSNIGIRGTVPYMPKELFCGGEYRASVDIYEAAGVWKYLLTGSHPWAGYETHAVMFKVGSGEIPEIPNNCSEETKQLLKRMFNPDSEKRPTAKELLQDPTFSDTSESVLDEVLVEVLVDTQLLWNDGNLAFAPMTLDGDDDEPDTAHPL